MRDEPVEFQHALARGVEPQIHAVVHIPQRDLLEKMRRHHRAVSLLVGAEHAGLAAGHDLPRAAAIECDVHRVDADRARHRIHLIRHDADVIVVHQHRAKLRLESVAHALLELPHIFLEPDLVRRIAHNGFERLALIIGELCRVRDRSNDGRRC